MAMTKEQYEHYYSVDKKRDNYPKYLHIDIKNNNNEHIKPSAICVYNGTYIRLYDNDKNRYYYYNDTYSVYLFLADDNMWTLSNTLSYSGNPYIIYCTKSNVHNILETNKWLWSNGESKLKFDIYIYYPKNNKINKNTSETYVQTSIDFSKLNKKERKHIKRCGINNKPNKVIKVSNNNNICSICWDEVMFLDKKTELMCGHVFHTKCIFKWIFSKKTCPNCRNDHTIYMQ